VQAVADEPGHRLALLGGAVDKQLVVQAQHDPAAEGTAPGADRDRPHLEQLGRRALDHRVARVPAVGGGPAGVPGGLIVGGREHDQPPAVRAQVTAGPPGPVGGVEVGHRHRVGRVEPAQRLGAVTGGLAVHGGEHGDLGGRPVQAELLGHRGVEVVSPGRVGQRPVPGDGGQHPRLDLAEIGPDEDVPVLGHDRLAQRGRHVVQPRGRGHPARGPVRSGPAPAQPAVGPEVLIQPGVAVGGGDAFRLAPLQQGANQRMRVTVFPQPPRPRVRHVHADPGQQRAHLRRAAQVRGRARRRVAQHLLVTGGAQGGGFGLAARPRPDEPGEHPLSGCPVHRQPVHGQLGAQQLGRGLAAGRGDRGVAREGTFLLGQRGERLLLQLGGCPGEFRPPGDALGAHRPAAADPLRPQVPARRDRVFLVAVLRAEQAEQVGRSGGRQRIGGQPAQPGPGKARIGPPSAEQQPVRRGDIPARRQPYPGGQTAGQALCRLARPHRPPRPQRLIRPAHLGEGTGTARERPAAGRRGDPEHGLGPLRRRDDKTHQIAPGHAALAQRRRQVRVRCICHEANPATNRASTAAPAIVA
jgi:hypothetical protein